MAAELFDVARKSGGATLVVTQEQSIALRRKDGLLGVVQGPNEGAAKGGRKGDDHEDLMKTSYTHAPKHDAPNKRDMKRLKRPVVEKRHTVANTRSGYVWRSSGGVEETAECGNCVSVRWEGRGR